MSRVTCFVLVCGILSDAGAVDGVPPTSVAFETECLAEAFYSEGATSADIDGDGVGDLVAGPYWYAGPGFETKHEIYPAESYDPKGYSHNFLTFASDIDEDGKVDAVVFGFPGAEIYWYRNPGGKEGHWEKYLALPVGDNESPHFTDIDGDGRPEILCSIEGKFVAVSPGEDPKELWMVREISGKATGGKYTHGLGVGDVNGDGRLDLLDKESWWEQPATWPAGTHWKRHRFAFAGPGGSQMFAYDFDGDGDNDILTSLHAHGFGLAWYEQREKADGSRTFVQHLITGERPAENPFGLVISQMHAIDMEDIDGDGVEDIVTGKRWWAHGGKDPGADMPAVLYWFKTVRGGESGKAQFLPYQIHGDSGVGTQVDAVDVNGDGKTDVVVGNKKGTFVHLQQ